MGYGDVGEARTSTHAPSGFERVGEMDLIRQLGVDVCDLGFQNFRPTKRPARLLIQQHTRGVGGLRQRLGALLEDLQDATGTRGESTGS